MNKDLKVKKVQVWFDNGTSIKMANLDNRWFADGFLGGESDETTARKKAVITEISGIIGKFNGEEQ